MKKRNVKSLVLATIAALSVGLTACGAKDTPAPGQESKPIQQVSNENQGTDASTTSAHHFENGVCTDCGKEWATALYEAGVAKFQAHSNGHCYFSLPVDDGYVSFSLDKRTFYIEYETDIKDDEQTTYTFRTYVIDDGEVIYKDDTLEYTYHDPNAEPDANAPISDLNIDYTIERHFGDTDEGEYTYLSTYTCPVTKLVDAYKTKEILQGDDAFRFLWYKNFEDNQVYTQRDFEKGEISMQEIFGDADYMTGDEFLERYMTDYERCLKGMDQALKQLGFDLAGYGIVY